MDWWMGGWMVGLEQGGLEEQGLGVVVIGGVGV